MDTQEDADGAGQVRALLTHAWAALQPWAEVPGANTTAGDAVLLAEVAVDAERGLAGVMAWLAAARMSSRVLPTPPPEGAAVVPPPDPSVPDSRMAIGTAAAPSL